MTWHRHDVVVLTDPVVEGFPKVRDVSGQRIVFDDGIGPDALEDLRLRDDVRTSIDQDTENVIILARQRDEPSVTLEQALRAIELERAEPPVVTGLW
jgi:hypothetical protein